ncbi:MAG: hypothetical protein ABIS86_03780 [Streptosporangiaceae bacterium]
MSTRAGKAGTADADKNKEDDIDELPEELPEEPAPSHQELERLRARLARKYH